MAIPQDMQQYIQKVCTGAAKSEDKPDNTLYQMCIIKNYVIVSISSPYIRVSRRILYRLSRNFNRNFKGYQLKLIPSCKADFQLLFYNDAYNHIHGFDVYPLKDGFDPNFGMAYWNFFGKDYVMQCFCDNSLISEDAGKPGTVYANLHFENLINHSGDPEYCNHTHSWSNYRKNYLEIYGHEPYVIETTYRNF